MRISDWSSDVCSSELVPQSSVAEWLREHTSGGARIGYDPWLHTKRWVNQAAEALAEKGAELIAVNSNPVDAVWPDRPAPRQEKLIVHPESYGDRSSTDKRDRKSSVEGKRAAGSVKLGGCRN